ncbi:MAG: putrescine/spermidine ABC transporter substrate-binding protein, partial [Pseudomonadota bacterium]
MKLKLVSLASAALLAFGASAHAEGELNIFNWGNYTNPDLIKKFEAEHK